MRLVKLGPTDLRVQQILSGVKEGEKVVLLGSIIMQRPAKPPTITLAEGLRRGSGESTGAKQSGAASSKGDSAAKATRTASPSPRSELAKAVSSAPGKP
jgi:hypothetical protein